MCTHPQYSMNVEVRGHLWELGIKARSPGLAAGAFPISPVPIAALSRVRPFSGLAWFLKVGS